MNKKDKNEEKKTFKELWANKQTKAIIKLGMWFASFFLLFVVLSIASLFTDDTKVRKNNNDENVVEEKVEANMITLLNNLNNSSYSYEYKVNNTNEVYTYNGTKDKTEENGFYQKNNEIYKYQVKEGIFYKVDNENITDEIILNETDQENFKLENILNSVRTYETSNKAIIENDVYTYNIDENYIINITKSGNNISNINIKINDIEYSMNFKNIVSE